MEEKGSSAWAAHSNFLATLSSLHTNAQSPSAALLACTYALGRSWQHDELSGEIRRYMLVPAGRSDRRCRSGLRIRTQRIHSLAGYNTNLNLWRIRRLAGDDERLPHHKRSGDRASARERETHTQTNRQADRQTGTEWLQSAGGSVGTHAKKECFTGLEFRWNSNCTYCYTKRGWCHVFVMAGSLEE